MQTGQKAARVRDAYEAGGGDLEIRAQIRKSLALDWLLHHVDFVDPEGNALDREQLLGDDHDHDHDGHDHDDHDHDDADDIEPATEAEQA